MKVGEILANSVLQIDVDSKWSDSKSFGELDTLSRDELLSYTRQILTEYVDLGYKVHEIANYIKFVQQYKVLK